MRFHFSRLMILSILILVGCVQVDPDTGKTLPRGNQRYEFETVERLANQLKERMSKMQVLYLLGSPSEKSSDGDVWVYLPERPAVLIPGRALRLEFQNGLLVKYGYRAIILGQDL